MRVKPDTTALEVLRVNPELFTWGKIVRFHDIGRYTFVEYLGLIYEKGRVVEGAHMEEAWFSVYVDGKTALNSASSLDSALLFAVAYANLETNEARWMHIAALKLIGLKE